LFENPSLTTYRVTCPDGKTYGNDVPGTSSTFGATWLAKKAPGVVLACNGSEKDCKLELWGTSSGAATLAVCK
jgi:hypothetical protein